MLQWWNAHNSRRNLRGGFCYLITRTFLLRLATLFVGPATQKGSEWDSCRWEGEMKAKISHFLSHRLGRFLLLRPGQHNHTRSSVIPSGARNLLFLLIPVLAASLALASSASAQQAKTSDLASLQAYSAAREGSLVGTVVRYDPASSTAPVGAHVLIQTASGQVDVHLGNAKLLEANHLQLNVGDSVRVVGEPLALGDTTFFAARILQKGTQAVALRSSRGFLLTPASTLTETQREALRGVR